MKIRARLLSTLLIMGVTANLFVGCSSEKVENKNVSTTENGNSNKGEPGNNTDKLKEVELTWYYRADPTPEQDKVFTEANKIIKEKINANVKFVPLAPSEYEQKMQSKYAAGDAGDVNFTASWTNNYAQNVGKGAYLPIDELLKEYAPQVNEFFTEDQWKAVKIDGQIYGVPNAQIFAKTDLITVRKDLADKYGLDVASVKSIEDIEPWVADVVVNEPGVVFEWFGAGRLSNLINAYGYDDITPIAWVKYDDESLTAVNIYETQEFEHLLQMAKRWADNGYIANDAMVKKDQEAEKKANKIMGHNRGVYKPGIEAAETQNWGQPMVCMPISESVLKTSGITSTINAIPTTSKNPERAMMLIELMNTNPDLYNLICFGLEGEHYQVVADNTVKVTNPEKYKGINWVIGNTFNGYLLEGQAADTWEKTIEMNNTAVPSVALGFTFDATPVKTQIAQVQTVVDEYIPGLVCGAVDVETVLPEFRAKLQSAGADKIVEEAQKQLDEWKLNK